MSKYFTRLLFVILLMWLYPFRVLSQDCQTRYLSLTYKGTTWDTFSHAAYAPNNEIIAAGSLVDYNGSAHLARYSKNGIPIWSNYYNIGYFTFYNPTFFSKVKFNDFVLTPDGGIVIAGTVLRYYNNRVHEIYSKVALLSKLDKYGNVVWTRSYMPANGYADLSFSNIYQTTDGDFIVYMAHDKGPSLYAGAASHNRVIRFSSTGQIKWATSLYTGHYDAGGTGVSFRRGITQLANRNIVIGDAVYQTARGADNLRMSDGRLHFFSLDYITGGIKWESSYPYTLPATDTFFVPDINHIAELPDGKLSFTTSLYLITPALPALTKRPVSIITDNKGVTQQLVTYYLPSGNECLLKDVTAASLPGTKSMLLKDGSLSVVATINPDGSVSAAKGYNSSYPPNCFAVGPRGNSIFMSDNRSLSYKLMMTDSNGNSACADAATALLSESLAPANDNPAIVITIPAVYTSVSYRDYFTDYEYPLKIKSEYPLVTTTDCEQLLDCCRDIIDTVNISNVTICEGASYRLPDNTEIKNSGTYYFTYQSVTGCDSITYLKLKLDKNPNSLSLGADSCLTGNNQVTLKATQGYDTYSWMGNAPMASDTFVISRPGVYRVRVTNVCGSKTDSVEIFDRCDFPVFLPTGFTPNRDNLNDDFGVPRQNKNRLISLTVYNRWGQVVFATNSVQKRWDGTFKGQVLKTDIFVYYLVMKGLSGNTITQKGNIMLIR